MKSKSPLGSGRLNARLSLDQAMKILAALRGLEAAREQLDGSDAHVRSCVGRALPNVREAYDLGVVGYRIEVYHEDTIGTNRVVALRRCSGRCSAP
jgi:hypothetical protein